MWPPELVQYIKCGGDDYFIQIFPLFFVHLSLPPLSVSYLVAPSACLRILKGCLLLRILGGLASLSFLLELRPASQAKIRCACGPFFLLGSGPRFLFHTQFLPSHNLHQKHQNVPIEFLNNKKMEWVIVTHFLKECVVCNITCSTHSFKNWIAWIK